MSHFIKVVENDMNMHAKFQDIRLYRFL
jgi:hypothetical protein